MDLKWQVELCQEKVNISLTVKENGYFYDK